MGLFFICRSRLLAVKNRQVRARRAVIGRVAEQVTPLRGRPGLVSLPRVDHTQHVAGIKLPGLQAQRGEHLLFRFDKHATPFVNQAEIEMRLGTVWSEPNGKPQRICCRLEAAILE